MFGGFLTTGCDWCLSPEFMSLIEARRDSLHAAMSRKQTGMVVVLVGIVAALIAALANPLGIGHAGFGWKQGVLLAIGVLLIIGGGVMALRPPSGGTGAPPTQ